MDITETWQFFEILNWLRKGMQTCSFTVSRLVFTLSFGMFNILYEIMGVFFGAKKKTIRQKYENRFQLSKANVDLNRSGSSWLTATDN